MYACARVMFSSVFLFFVLLLPSVFIVAIVRHVAQNKVMYIKQAKKAKKNIKNKSKR